MALLTRSEKPPRLSPANKCSLEGSIVSSAFKAIEYEFSGVIVRRANEDPTMLRTVVAQLFLSAVSKEQVFAIGTHYFVN